MSAVKELEVLRPAGLLEKYSTYRHHFGFYLNVAATAWYRHGDSRFSESELRKLMYAALHQLIQQNPILSAIPVDEDTEKPYFARLPFVDLEKAVVYRPLQRQEELDALIQLEHNTDFKAEYGARPFWRLVLIPVEDEPEPGLWISWVFHHALADGSSGLAFHRKLLAALKSLAASPLPDVPSRVPPPSSSLSPPLDDLHGLPVSWTYMIKAVWAEMFGGPSPGLWAGAPYQLPLKTLFHSRTLSATEMAAVVAECRAQSTTVTALVQVAFAAATLETFPQHDEVTLGGNIDMRRWLPKDAVTADTLGCYLTQYSDRYERDPLEKGFWDEARRARGVIREALQGEGKDSTCGLLRYAGDIGKYFQGKIGKQRTDSLEVSSLGVFDGRGEGDEGLWRVGRMVFSQNPSVTGSALTCNVVSVKDGPMVLGFCWQEGVVDSEDVLRIVEGVHKRLLLC